MTAPAADAGVKVGEPNAAGEAPIRFPVLVLEGQEEGPCSCRH